MGGSGGPAQGPAEGGQLYCAPKFVKQLGLGPEESNSKDKKRKDLFAAGPALRRDQDVELPGTGATAGGSQVPAPVLSVFAFLNLLKQMS